MEQKCHVPDPLGLSSTSGGPVGETEKEGEVRGIMLWPTPIVIDKQSISPMMLKPLSNSLPFLENCQMLIKKLIYLALVFSDPLILPWRMISKGKPPWKRWSTLAKNAVQKIPDMINKRDWPRYLHFCISFLCTTILFSKKSNFIDLSQRNCAIKKNELKKKEEKNAFRIRFLTAE